MELLTAGQFVAGLVGLVVGARMLVAGASKLAVTIGVPPLVIGLTVVAFGTGAPELAVTLRAALTGDADLGVGNVVGSNIANILLVIGLSALITPLAVRTQLVRWDVPVMIVVSGLLLGLGWDGRLDRVDGGILFGGIVLYMLVSIVIGRRQEARNRTLAGPELEGEIPKEPARGAGQVVLQLLLIAVGLVLLVGGAELLVRAAVVMAKALGVGELVIGTTIVAVGTSLPEAATSVVAGLKGERDLALGNAVGSNIFNILAVLGIAGLASAEPVAVNPEARAFAIPVMIAVAVVTLPVVFTGGRIARWEGGVFLLYFAAFNAYLFLEASGHALLPEFRWAMLVFVIPLTALGLVLAVVRAVRSGRTTQALQSGG